MTDKKRSWNDWVGISRDGRERQVQIALSSALAMYVVALLICAIARIDTLVSSRYVTSGMLLYVGVFFEYLGAMALWRTADADRFSAEIRRKERMYDISLLISGALTIACGVWNYLT